MVCFSLSEVSTGTGLDFETFCHDHRRVPLKGSCFQVSSEQWDQTRRETWEKNEKNSSYLTSFLVTHISHSVFLKDFSPLSALSPLSLA